MEECGMFHGEDPACIHEGSSSMFAYVSPHATHVWSLLPLLGVALGRSHADIGSSNLKPHDEIILVLGGGAFKKEKT